MINKLRKIEDVVDKHFNDVRYYSDSHALKDRWASMAMDKIRAILEKKDEVSEGGHALLPGHANVWGEPSIRAIEERLKRLEERVDFLDPDSDHEFE